MKQILKKVISMLIVVCLMIGIANLPTYAAVTAISPKKTTEAVLSQPYYTPAQLAKQKLTSSTDEKTVTVKEGKVKELKKEKADNGQNKYFAILEDSGKNLKVEIDESLFNFVESNGIKDSLTISINNAKAKINNDGSYEIEKSAAEVTINLSQEKATEISNKNNNYQSSVTVENEKTGVDSSSALTNTTIPSGGITKVTLEYTKAYVKSLANKNLTAINNLLKNKSLSSTVNSWLNDAKNLINSVVNGKQNNTEKVNWLNKAYTAIQTVSKAKCSLSSFVNKSFSDIFSFVKNTFTYKVIVKYAEIGLNVINTLSNKLSLSANTVFNAFVKMGVTKDQIKKVGSSLLSLMKKGEKFKNCAALAVAKYLGISHSMAAVYNLAADISLDKNYNPNVFYGTSGSAELKTIRVNGKKDANEYESTLSVLKSGLQVGEKALIHVKCFDGGGHAITIVKEKNGYFGVYDINKNNGNKVSYSSSQFDKLMKGTIKNGYYSAVSNGKISMIANSKTLATKIEDYEFKNSTAYKLEQQNLTLINKQLQTKGLSPLAKTWLEEAKKLIIKVAKGDYIKYETTYINKEEFLRNSLIALKEIEKAKFSKATLIEHTSTEPYIDYDSKNVFYPLRKVLENN